MKKISFLLMCLFSSMMMQAGEITEAQALQKAQQILKGRQLVKERARTRGAESTSPAYYVFNAEANGGFAIIASNDQMPEVLGYAEQGHLNLAQVPDNVKWLLDYYEGIAKSLKKSSAPGRRAGTRSASERAELVPLLNTKWNQYGIYQEQCPDISGTKTLTGCVATAMAQVVNFFQWPLNSVREAVGYTSNKNEAGKTEIDLPSLPARKFNWFNMTNDDIAWLMRYCGQSVLMNYNLDESTSSPSSIPGALISVFNFSKGVDLVDRKEFTDEEWEQALYHEIELGRPVIYSGFKNKKGHTFVLHGYKNGQFYINWGWGGVFDGYFALTSLTPGDNDFTEDQNAVVGIQPASNNDVSYEEKQEIGFREVHVEHQGQLATLLPESERYLISRLKVTGEIGGKDIDVIRDMSFNKYGNDKQGRLSKLDLSEARLVSGEKYLCSDREYDLTDDVLGDNIFFNCYTLTNVILPKTLREICNSAFNNTSLTSIVVPKSVTTLATDAISVPTLNSIQVEEGNPNYFSQNNAIYEKSTGKLVRGCRASGIPEGVTEIGNSAFRNADLEKIIFPKSLKKLGSQSFCENGKIKDIHIPASIEEIGDRMFENCYLQTITVDNDNPVFDSRDNCNAIIETANNTLLRASNATTVVPATVTGLANGAFANLEIKSIDIPQTVTNYGLDLFDYSQTSIFHVHYPEPIEIPENAFNIIENGQVANLLWENARLIVPDGTKAKYAAATGWKVFGMGSYKIIEESEYNASRQYTVTLTEAGTLKTTLPQDKKDIVEELTVKGPINGGDIQCLKGMCGQYGVLTSINLSDATIVEGEGTTANVLPDGAFQTTMALQHIVLPKNLTAIGSYAFQDSGIEELVLPATVKELGRDIFYYARNLKALSVESGNTVFDSRDNCNAIIETASNTLRIGCANTVVPDGIEALGQMAFSGIPSLKEVKLPSGLTSIGWAAFWADTELSKVTLSESVTDIGESPFGGCERITSLVIDAKNGKYDSRNNCNAIIETATDKLIQGFATTKIPEGVKTIATAAFRSLFTLTEIEIPASVEKIEPEAFLYCNQMTKVVSHIKKPFAVSSMVFSGDNMKIAKLYVPYGTREAYANTPGWDNFKYIIEMEPVEGEYTKNGASVVTTDFGKAYAALNGKVSVPVTLAGEGMEPVTSIGYTITTGSTTTEHQLELSDPVTFMMSAEVLVPIDADASVGESNKVFKLTKVNGVANECTTGNMQASGKLVTVAKKPKVVPVVEEATGTWCGWCARGIPGLALLNKIYRDDVITLAVHGGGNGDPMILDNYQLDAFSYPSCTINRGEVVDPYYGSGSTAFGISREVEAVQRSYVPAGIEVTADWADANQTKISVKATTTFVENVSNANYRIGYVLAEDGLSGTTPAWYQSNYYAGSSLKDDNLVNLTGGESKITNVVYNYIPVAAYEPFEGIEGSVPATITKDVAMEHAYTIDIAGNDRIQDKQKLSVVALLIDKDTKKIVNAAKFKFDKESDAGSAGFQFLKDKLKGDANGDDKVDAADIVEMVNAKNGHQSNRFKLSNAELDGKDGITDADIEAVVKIIMSK
ncbi:MAG: leucine-rich repeat protein [Prevotella sp.]|nr:leucine-rich repeat protein [Prevotella sp.]